MTLGGVSLFVMLMAAWWHAFSAVNSLGRIADALERIADEHEEVR